MKTVTGLAAAVIAMAAAGVAHAGVILLDNTPYTENFNSMGTSGTPNLPTGWQARWINSPNANSFNVALGDLTTALSGTSQGTATNGVYNGGSNGNADRSLVTMSGGPFFTADLGVQNNTGTAMTGFSLDYYAELLYIRKDTKTETRRMFYSTDPNGAAGTWVELPADFAVTFTVTPPGTNQTVNSNLDDNRQLVSASFTFSTPVAAGETFYLRWFDQHGEKFDGTIASNGSYNLMIGIDDVSLSATTSVVIPEPATLGLGVAGLAGLTLVRRRRA